MHRYVSTWNGFLLSKSLNPFATSSLSPLSRCKCIFTNKYLCFSSSILIKWFGTRNALSILLSLIFVHRRDSSSTTSSVALLLKRVYSVVVLLGRIFDMEEDGKGTCESVDAIGVGWRHMKEKAVSTLAWVRMIYGGGVTSMPSFLEHFFPDVYKKIQEHGVDSNYCKYDNQTLQLFTSSLYLAALVATMFASSVTRKLGRKHTMLIAGVFFIVGTVLNSVANSLLLLILGRLLLGCGVGFANQAVPVFLSEIAPTRIRGALNILFQLNITIGILIANIVNYFTAQ
ncbi:hypothetical protein VNO80_16777 [Phaseolus coccineus]|uniref:Major facilitator superfamily (MFS) profile domain-containing protein n=1 Tax=Phaseolus coccineus TaxID=3886 RepID=A0AAN9MRT2_PHACN